MKPLADSLDSRAPLRRQVPGCRDAEAVDPIGKRDFARLVERIRLRKPDGWTALYDALGTYLDGAGQQDGRKVRVSRRKDGTSAFYAVADQNVYHLCEQVCGGLQTQLAELTALMEGTTPERNPR